MAEKKPHPWDSFPYKVMYGQWNDTMRGHNLSFDSWLEDVAGIDPSEAVKYAVAAKNAGLSTGPALTPEAFKKKFAAAEPVAGLQEIPEDFLDDLFSQEFKPQTHKSSWDASLGLKEPTIADKLELPLDYSTWTPEQIKAHDEAWLVGNQSAKKALETPLSWNEKPTQFGPWDSPGWDPATAPKSEVDAWFASNAVFGENPIKKPIYKEDWWIPNSASESDAKNFHKKWFQSGSDQPFHVWLKNNNIPDFFDDIVQEHILSAESAPIFYESIEEPSIDLGPDTVSGRKLKSLMLAREAGIPIKGVGVDGKIAGLPSPKKMERMASLKSFSESGLGDPSKAAAAAELRRRMGRGSERNDVKAPADFLQTAESEFPEGLREKLKMAVIRNTAAHRIRGEDSVKSILDTGQLLSPYGLEGRGIPFRPEPGFHKPEFHKTVGFVTVDGETHPALTDSGASPYQLALRNTTTKKEYAGRPGEQHSSDFPVRTPFELDRHSPVLLVDSSKRPRSAPTDLGPGKRQVPLSVEELQARTDIPVVERKVFDRVSNVANLDPYTAGLTRRLAKAGLLSFGGLMAAPVVAQAATKAGEGDWFGAGADAASLVVPGGASVGADVDRIKQGHLSTEPDIGAVFNAPLPVQGMAAAAAALPVGWRGAMNAADSQWPELDVVEEGPAMMGRRVDRENLEAGLDNPRRRLLMDRLLQKGR